MSLSSVARPVVRPQRRYEVLPGGQPVVSSRFSRLYWDALLAFARRNVRVHYKQAALGLAWVVMQPLALLVLFIVFLGRVAKVPSGPGLPYAAFALSAIVPWQFVSGAVSTAGSALVSDSVLLRRVYFPRELSVLGAIVADLPDLAIGIALFAALGPALGAHFGLSLLWLPVLCALLLLPVAAVSLPLAAVTAYSRDLLHALPVATQLWLFASPVAYPLTAVAARWRWVYALANPVAGPIDGFRHVATGSAPDLGLLGWSALGAGVLLALGVTLFARLEGDVADVV
jgi:lipopolysaccharide transport system permease protein